MKKVLLVLAAALFVGACAQKTCPTYASNDLTIDKEVVEVEAAI